MISAIRCWDVIPGQFDRVGEEEGLALVVGLPEGSLVGAAVVGAAVGFSEGTMVGGFVAPSTEGAVDNDG